MNRRVWKVVGLVVAGGVLFQAASCAWMVAETVVSNVLPALLSQLLLTQTGTTP